MGVKRDFRASRVRGIEPLGSGNRLQRLLEPSQIAKQEGAVAEELRNFLPGGERMQPHFCSQIHREQARVPMARPTVEVFVGKNVAAGVGVLVVELLAIVIPAEERVIGHANQLERIAQPPTNGDREGGQR